MSIDFSAADNGSCGFSYQLSNQDSLLFTEGQNTVTIETKYDLAMVGEYQMTFQMSSLVYPNDLASDFDFVVRLRVC